MKIKNIAKAYKKQLGFTLIELLVALTIVGFLVVAAGAGIFQVMTRSGPGSNSLQAINNVQNAGEWISRDAANAEEVSFDGNYCPTFIWHDFGPADEDHRTTVRYYLSDGSLMREFNYGIVTGVLPVDRLMARKADNSSIATRNLILTIYPISLIMSNLAQSGNEAGSGEIPQIWTDKADYAPGETVQVGGKGFWPEEPIHLYAVGSPNGLHFAGEGAADKKGGFSTVMQLPEEQDDVYILTASGGNSGLTTQTSFRDSTTPISVQVGPQSAPLTYGTGGSVTYHINIGTTGSGNGNTTLSIVNWLPSQPTGLTPAPSFNPASFNLKDLTTSSLTINTTNTTPAGTYSFIVQASGGSNPTGNGTLTIGTSTTTSTSVSSSVNPSDFGQSVTFTATVTGSGGTPTGTVNFRDGGSTLGTGTLNGSGIATYSTSSLTAGSYAVTAAYGGDAHFSTSTSPVLTQTVNSVPNATATSLSSSANPSTQGQSVSFTATVTGSGGTPTGTVQFRINGANFGLPATLTGGTAASDATSSLAMGSNAITAVYSGDASYSASTGTLTQMVSDSSVPTPSSATTFIAKNISIDEYQRNGGVITLKISSVVGAGSSQATETRTYKLTMRNYTPTP